MQLAQALSHLALGQLGTGASTYQPVALQGLDPAVLGNADLANELVVQTALVEQQVFFFRQGIFHGAAAVSYTHLGWGLKRVISAEDGSITGLESMNCVSVRDENGRFNPTYGDETRVFTSDCIILATGQKVDIDFLGDKYKEELKNARGLIEVGEHKDTRAPGIYAGGDAASGP